MSTPDPSVMGLLGSIAAGLQTVLLQAGDPGISLTLPEEALELLGAALQSVSHAQKLLGESDETC